MCFQEDNTEVKCLKTDSEKNCYTNTEVDLCRSTTCLTQDKSIEVNDVKTGSEDTNNDTEVIVSENPMLLKDQNNHEETFSKSQSEKTHNDVGIDLIENPMSSRGGDTEEKCPKSQPENIQNDTEPNLPGSLMCIEKAEEDMKSAEVKFPNFKLQNVRNNIEVNLKYVSPWIFFNTKIQFSFTRYFVIIKFLMRLNIRGGNYCFLCFQR